MSLSRQGSGLTKQPKSEPDLHRKPSTSRSSSIKLTTSNNDNSSWTTYLKNIPNQLRVEWSEKKHRWRKNELVKQFFDNENNSNNCTFGYFITKKAYIAVTNSRSADESSYSWKVIKDKKYHQIQEELIPIVDDIAQNNCKYKSPNSLWPSKDSTKKKHQFKLKAIEVYFDSDVFRPRDGFDYVWTIVHKTIQVPKPLIEKYNANEEWQIPKYFPLGAILSLGVLLQIADTDNLNEETRLAVKNAVDMLNKLRHEVEVAKVKSTVEVSEIDRIYAVLLSLGLSNEACATNVRVLYPSNAIGSTDIIVHSPVRCVIEVKTAQNWTDTIGQLFRFSTSSIKESNQSLFKYKKIAFLVNCNKCSECNEAKLLSQANEWKIDFVCSRREEKFFSAIASVVNFKVSED